MSGANIIPFFPKPPSRYPWLKPGATRKGGIAKSSMCCTFLYPSGTHLLESDYNIGTIQELPDHQEVNPTMSYTHVLNDGGNCLGQFRRYALSRLIQFA